MSDPFLIKAPLPRRFTRRSFLKTTAFAAGAIGIPARSWSQVAGANSDVRVAVIGFHGRGQEHISAWKKMAGVRLTALCDVDRDVLDGGVKSCADNGVPVAGYTDIRKLLESKDVDAISIATPNHWHALASIWGMQSGKDVYVEKPVSYDIWEGEQMVEAAKHYKKIAQAGTQSRSSQGIRDAVGWVRSGHLGRILRARAICYKRRPSIGKTNGPQAAPANVNYDLWCGPAPMNPPRRKKFHYDWHWFWDYGAGDLGNQCVHEVDVARWFLGEDRPSFKILSIGGRFGYEDDGETPNTLISFHDFDHAPLIVEVRGLPDKSGSTKMDDYKGAGIGVVVECESGYVTVSDYKSAKVFDNDGRQIKSFEGESSHFENFIQAVRSRRESDLHAPILEGHRSTALCHASNISYRVGSAQSREAMREQIQSDPDSLETFMRMMKHLSANGVDLEKKPAIFGAVIKMNPANGMIAKNKAANHLLERAPRPGYAIKVA